MIDKNKLEHIINQFQGVVIKMGKECEGEFIDVTMPGYITKTFYDANEAWWWCDTCHFYNTSASRGGWTGD